MDYDQNYGFTTMGSTRNRNDDTELRYLWQPVGAPREGKSLLNAFVGLLVEENAGCMSSFIHGTWRSGGLHTVYVASGLQLIMSMNHGLRPGEYH